MFLNVLMNFEVLTFKKFQKYKIARGWDTAGAGWDMAGGWLGGDWGRIFEVKKQDIF